MTDSSNVSMIISERSKRGYYEMVPINGIQTDQLQYDSQTASYTTSRDQLIELACGNPFICDPVTGMPAIRANCNGNVVDFVFITVDYDDDSGNHVAIYRERTGVRRIVVTA